MEDLFDDFTDDKPARTELDRLVPRRQAMAEAYMGICRGAREKAVLAEADGHGRVAYELSDQVIEAGIRAASVVQRDVCQSLALWWGDHEEIPRERLVQVVMDFAWLGLERLRAGERFER